MPFFCFILGKPEEEKKVLMLLCFYEHNIREWVYSKYIHTNVHATIIDNVSSSDGQKVCEGCVQLDSAAASDTAPKAKKDISNGR